jgi:type II restriction enzyme
MQRMKPKNIKKAVDLVTSHEAIRKGFLDQAVAKGKAAVPYIARARAFRKALAKVKSVDTLSEDLHDFKEEIAACAGLSIKGASHLSLEELERVVKVSLKAASAEDDFRQELVDRYLLTKGDTLGGSMRNWIGASAGEKLVGALVAALKKRKITPILAKTKRGKVRSLQWGTRYLLFDHKPKLLGKNIDAILIRTSGLRTITKDAFNDPVRYIAAGELKGGIDPAGADEHWKTANSALDRIRTRFAKEKTQPALFFVAAAIETAMSKEIFEQLKTGALTHAANLNSDKQLQDLASWLVGL